MKHCVIVMSDILRFEVSVFHRKIETDKRTNDLANNKYNRKIKYYENTNSNTPFVTNYMHSLRKSCVPKYKLLYKLLDAFIIIFF